MAEKTRLVLHIDAEAAALLDELTTPRGKGDYMSELIKQAAGRQQAAGILERIEAKIDAIIARGSTYTRP
jgi:hypothetical protein